MFQISGLEEQAERPKRLKSTKKIMEREELKKENPLKLLINSWTPLSCASMEMTYRTENHPIPTLATDWHTYGTDPTGTAKALKT